MEIFELQRGPNEFRYGNVIYKPGDDQVFFWPRVRLENTTAQKRRFNWTRCDLDHPQGEFLPGAAFNGLWIINDVNIEEIVEPGEIIERELMISYPEEGSPTRLKCGDIELPLALRE